MNNTILQIRQIRQQKWAFLHYSDGPLHRFGRHARPFQSVEQHRQLRRRQRQTPSRIGGQVKRPSSSHFVTRTMPLPSHASSFTRSISLRTEDKNIAAIWISPECFAHQRRQRMNALAKINRLRRQHDLQVRRGTKSLVAPHRRQHHGQCRLIDPALNPDPGASDIDLDPPSAPHRRQRRRHRIRSPNDVGIVRYRGNRIDLHRRKALLWLSDPSHCSTAGVAISSAIREPHHDGAPHPICSRQPQGSPQQSAPSLPPSTVAGAAAP